MLFSLHPPSLTLFLAVRGAPSLAEYAFCFYYENANLTQEVQVEGQGYPRDKGTFTRCEQLKALSSVQHIHTLLIRSNLRFLKLAQGDFDMELVWEESSWQPSDYSALPLPPATR